MRPRRPLVFLGILLQEMLHQQRNIFAALPQRRQIDADHVEPVEKIFAELALPHHLAKIHVGRGDDAHVHLNFLHAAEVHELAVLQYAQNLALRVHGHGADFVEEERAPVGNFEQSFLRSNRAGEGAFDVSEQHRFEQVGRRRAGIYRHEWPVAARGIQMNRLGDQFLARPALALQQHRRAAGRDLRDQIENLKHGLALAHDVFKVVALLERAFQLNVFFFRLLAERRLRARRPAVSRCPRASE